jgi:hypothetical protein
MTVKNANAMRAKFIKFFMEYAQESGEDVGLEAANIFSFPVVADDDGEEGCVQVVIKIPKDDDGDDCYSRREGYALKLAEKTEKAAAKAAEKAKKIAKDEARREAKKAEKAEKGT